MPSDSPVQSPEVSPFAAPRRNTRASHHSGSTCPGRESRNTSQSAAGYFPSRNRAAPMSPGDVGRAGLDRERSAIPSHSSRHLNDASSCLVAGGDLCAEGTRPTCPATSTRWRSDSNVAGSGESLWLSSTRSSILVRSGARSGVGCGRARARAARWSLRSDGLRAGRELKARACRAPTALRRCATSKRQRRSLRPWRRSHARLRSGVSSLPPWRGVPCVRRPSARRPIPRVLRPGRTRCCRR